jgi:hypothetical protein
MKGATRRDSGFRSVWELWPVKPRKPSFNSQEFRDMHESAEMGDPSPAPGIAGKSDKEAARIMADWFLANFENPAHSTPCDEGAYVYIWGGPYFADEELEIFGAGDKVLAMACAIIDDESEGSGPEWAPSHARVILARLI